MGIVLVGGSSILGGSSDKSVDAKQVILGMALIVLAQVSHEALVTANELHWSIEPYSLVACFVWQDRSFQSAT